MTKDSLLFILAFNFLQLLVFDKDCVVERKENVSLEYRF